MPLKNSCVFSFARIYPDTSMVASQRVAMLVSEQLQLPLITDLNIKTDVPRDLQALLIVNGAYGYCRCLPELGALVERAKRVIWIQQDYIIIPPKAESGAESPFRFAFRKRAQEGKPHIDYWTTIEPNAQKTGLSHYINWNALTFEKVSDEIIRQRRKSADADMLYYGSWRDIGGVGSKKSRVKYFNRYFQKPLIPITISAPMVKNRNKFQEKYTHENICHIGKILTNGKKTFYDIIGSHGSGLYIEDPASHSEYHSPPNRFYEMLSAGLPMIFQPECGSTLRKAYYDPTPFQASNPLEVQRLHGNREGIGQLQRKAWLKQAEDDASRVRNSLKDAARKLEAAL